MDDLQLKLQNELRKVGETITLYDLAKKLGVNLDELLTYIQDILLPHYHSIYKKNAFKIPFFNNEQIKEFFSDNLVDVGFLCQHKIKEINERLEKKLNTFAHQVFYNHWVMNRGY